MKSKQELILLLQDVLQNDIKHNKKKINTIKENLAPYQVSAGQVVMLINHAMTELDGIDSRLLCLFAEQVLLAADDIDVHITSFFSTREIKEAKTTFTMPVRQPLQLPYTFENVLRVADDEYITVVNGSLLKRLFDSGLIQYNPETQREARARHVNGRIIEMPKINSKRVKEISDCLEKNELISSTLTLNARLLSADEGEELFYADDRLLTVAEGTLLDILDGFHRLQAIVKTLSVKPDIDMPFTLRILNYDIQRAKMYFEQMNKTEPVAKSRLAEMNTTGMSNFIAKTVQLNSRLRGRVSSSDMIPPQGEFLVTFRTLQEAIQENFHVQNKAEAIAIAEFLTQFFNQLIEHDTDAFDTDIAAVRKRSIINANQMFYGYVALAKRFYQQRIDITRLSSLMEQIDFDRDNPLWRTLKIVDERGITNNMKKAITAYFKQLPIIVDDVNSENNANVKNHVDADADVGADVGVGGV